jgi:hypothetical protein
MIPADATITSVLLGAAGFTNAPNGAMLLRSRHWTDHVHPLRYLAIGRRGDGTWFLNGVGIRTPANWGELRDLCRLVGLDLTEPTS